MVATVAQPSISIKGSAADSSHCPSCGSDVPLLLPPPPEDLAAAQARIAELEGEVRALNDKAAMAINRWAEYEVELARLRSSPPRRGPTPRPNISSTEPDDAQQPLVLPATEHRAHLGAALLTQTVHLEPARGPAAGGDSLLATPTTPTVAQHMTEDLLEALTREQGLRQEAKGRLSATSKEMEELSVALFEQANEMVADERRARAKLEERVGELEKRDADKKRRLDRLESAINRIERVKSLLQE
ncbi:hypothetical protein BBAD15_g10942 [Beauveria bassiana D1-5]|uniref:GDP/GTP exchange factor Sec2 N-terminal domain-containing protein n=1 Tax=Beauveria bassiana D1-5 TaxID=1245745 RepID=A0A0A2VSP2_BEABA|nr:hypothetical protein BBAD15_g10942 [Beauveria bassiana D1-5]